MKKIEKAIILLSSFLIMGCSETSSSIDSKISDTSFFQTSEVNVMDKYKIVSGNFIVDDKNNFISQSDNSLIINKQDEFVYGHLSVDINIGNEKKDNGIIFSLEDNDLANFWEGNQVSYYFYFISISGTAYLGKTDNGNWSMLSEKVINNYSLNKTYNLKVEKDDTTIRCFVDEELYLTYNDDSPLLGKKFGLRAGGSNVSYSNIECVSSGTISENELKDFTNINGKFVEVNSYIKAKENNSICLYDNELTKGTISVKTNIPTKGSNSIIFSYKENQYYEYSVNSDLSVSLKKVNNQEKTLIKKTSLVAKYALSSQVELKVIFDKEIYTYIDDVCLIMSKQNELKFNKIGLKTDYLGNMFSKFKVDNNFESIKADLIIWGHSHMQLWANYKKDLAKYGKVINMGIGGSNTPYWHNLTDEILSYSAKKMVVMTGSNDLDGSNNDFIFNQVTEIFSSLKINNPDLEIVLGTEFLQPCRLQYESQVNDLNRRYIEYARKNDWLNIFDNYDIVLNSDGSLNQNIFMDIYHLTTEGYNILKDRVISSLDKTNLVSYSRCFDVKYGNFENNENIVSKNKSLGLLKNAKVKNGEINTKVKLNDCSSLGIVFNVEDHNLSSYFELNEDVSYYYIKIEKNKLSLIKNKQGIISTLKEMELNISPLNIYDLSIKFNDGLIDITFSNVNIIYQDNEKLLGKKLGIRFDEGGGEVLSLDYISYQEEYNFTIGEEDNIEINNNQYKSLKANQMIMFNNKTFTGGTIEFDMVVNASTNDHFCLIANGVVFGASSVNVNHNNGEFYVFGRCPWGSMTGFSKDPSFMWEDNQKALVNQISVGQKQHYKYIYDNINHCVYMYVNDNLLACSSLRRKFNGQNIGLYFASKDTIISSLSFKEEKFTKDDKYNFTCGGKAGWDISLKDNQEVFVSKGSNSILMFNDITLQGGTIEFEMLVPDNNYLYSVAIGVIFGADTLDAEHNTGKWYCVGRDKWDDFVCFSKDNGLFKWEDSNKVASSVIANQTYTYKIVWDYENDTIDYYLNNEYKSTQKLSFHTGGKYVGLYSETSGVIISNLKINK